MFTGPGLQIHCMQVHKENIDKVPNAIKGRDNIMLEICGMDNVPEEDLVEHEKQKGNVYEGGGGGADDGDDSPTPPPQQQPPKPQSTGTIHGPLPHMPPPFTMMDMMSHMAMMGHMQMMPMMMPPGNPMMMMPPPPMPHYMPPPVTNNSTTSTVQNVNFSNNTTTNTNTSSPQLTASNSSVKPLFPSAANLDTDSERYPNGQPKVKIETITAGSKIIHPDEDISLVS